jgi:hypothetical protein
MIALEMNALATNPPDTNVPGIDAARASSRLLTDLLRRENGAMADFLVALADFDRGRLWLQLGHASLFDFLHQELGLSRGSAHYRKVITPENRADVLPQFLGLSKQEAKAVAVEIRPAEVVPRKEMVTALPVVSRAPAGVVQPVEHATTELLKGTAPPTPQLTSEPLTSDLRRLHMTVSKQFLQKLEAARKGQGHAQPGASAEKVLEAALDLMLAAQARRRAEVKRPQQNPRPAKNPSHVPAAVKRAVWARDEGKCQWPVDGGGICGSTLRLEIDHIRPLARGGDDGASSGCTGTVGEVERIGRRGYHGPSWPPGSPSTGCESPSSASAITCAGWRSSARCCAMTSLPAATSTCSSSSSRGTSRGWPSFRWRPSFRESWGGRSISTLRDS